MNIWYEGMCFPTSYSRTFLRILRGMPGEQVDGVTDTELRAHSWFKREVSQVVVHTVHGEVIPVSAKFLGIGNVSVVPHFTVQPPGHLAIHATERFQAPSWDSHPLLILGPEDWDVLLLAKKRSGPAPGHSLSPISLPIPISSRETWTCIWRDQVIRAMGAS